MQWVIGSFLVGFVGTWYFVFFANGRDGRRLVDEEVLRRDVRYFSDTFPICRDAVSLTWKYHCCR